MLTAWLAPEINKLPTYASHFIGKTRRGGEKGEEEGDAGSSIDRGGGGGGGRQRE